MGGGTENGSTDDDLVLWVVREWVIPSQDKKLECLLKLTGSRLKSSKGKLFLHSTAEINYETDGCGVVWRPGV